MEEKLRFVFEYKLGERSMTELCDHYQIARETGYVWLRRYRQAGAAGPVERSRATLRHQNQTREEIAQMVLELRQAHMRWRPSKLKRILERNEPGRSWPASSTIGALLKRAGLVVDRKKCTRMVPYTVSLAHVNEANRARCADFKGWFRNGDGWRIDPLTISDAHSRYLLRCQAVARLSRLAACWKKLGIAPERIEAGHPEQNRRHEQMHRTLKQEGVGPRAVNLREHQWSLDRFRQEYNQVGPHEALEMQTQAAVNQLSARKAATRPASKSCSLR